MRLYIFLITELFLFCSCNDTRRDKNHVTDTCTSKKSIRKYSDSTDKIDTNSINIARQPVDTLPNSSIRKMTLVSSGQMLPFITIKLDGCEFDLVTSKSDTIYLATRDMYFRTPEGYKVGTEFSKLPEIIQQVLFKEPGWGYYCKLPSGWMLGFCEGNSCTDRVPTNTSKVKWIFKRQY